MTSKSKRVILLTLLGVVAVVGGLFAGAWWLVSSAPRYWATVDARSPEVRQRATAVENLVATQTTSVRSDMDRWSIELTQDQVNAWLATRLRPWMANQGVHQKVIEFIPNVLVNVAGEKLEFAAELKLNGKTQIVSFVYEPKKGEGADPVRLDLAGVYAGRLPLPLDWTVEQIKQKLGQRGQTEADKLRTLLESVELVLQLDDGRTVKVVGMELNNGKAVLTCQTDLQRTAQAARIFRGG